MINQRFFYASQVLKKVSQLSAIFCSKTSVFDDCTEIQLSSKFWFSQITWNDSCLLRRG